MNKYIDTFIGSSIDTSLWVFNSVIGQVQWYQNYFWGLIFISLFAWGLEVVFPWRKSQSVFRKDFWLDGFYMFFNFFVFSIIISGFYAVFGVLAEEYLDGLTSLSIIDLSGLPNWLQLVIFFVVLDFVQWLTHVILHKVDFLWQFHKVHHSVVEMGFAAHLRYHWMENVLYKPLKTLGVMLLGGFEPEKAFIVHFFAITIGHINHANVRITWGPFKYIFNNPVMHLWHHAMNLPLARRNGVNYGISLSLWDYIFRTNYIPTSDGKVSLGFSGINKFPRNFKGQLTQGFKRVSAGEE